MKPLREEDLILYYYGEVPDGSEIESQIEGSPELQERYRAVCRLLDSVGEHTVPELHSAYGSRIWHRIAPHVEAESTAARRWRWLQPNRRWAWAAGLAVLLIGAFVAGGGDPAIPRSILGVNEEYLDAAFDEMETKYGTIERYFSDGLGIDAAQQQALRDLYLK